MRDVQMALPCELGEQDQVALTRRFAAALCDRYGTTVSWAVHRPRQCREGEDPEDAPDPRNVHAHIVLPTRTVTASGEFGKKLRVLDALSTGALEIARLRALWETTANAALEAAGETARVYVGLRLDAPPEPTAPRGAERDVREAYKPKTGRAPQGFWTVCARSWPHRRHHPNIGSAARRAIGASSIAGEVIAAAFGGCVDKAGPRIPSQSQGQSGRNIDNGGQSWTPIF